MEITVTVVYLGHKPGVGAYGIEVDEGFGPYIVFRGTLSECGREMELMGQWGR